MSRHQIRSWFEFDEHRHLIMQEDGTPVASVKFGMLSDGRDNAVNCMAAVKILFGADSHDEALVMMEYQRVNLTNKTSMNGWKQVVEALEEGHKHIDMSWEPVVRDLTRATLKNWYEGSASHQPMFEIDPDEVISPFLINPLVSSTGMTMHFSKPGSSKSMVALAIAVSVATGYPIFGAVPQSVGPVVYVDFEDDIKEHNVRLTAILNSIGWEGEWPRIIHYKVAGRLVDQLSQIRSVVRKEKAALVIVDSLGKARNTDASDGDATIKLTNAIESFGMPVLAIDHVTKVDNKQISTGKVTHPDSMMAIGSQFSTAGSRLGWFFQEMSDSTHEVKRYNLHNTKHNHVAKQEPRSLKIEITNNERGVATGMAFSVWDTLKFEEFVAEEAYDMIAKWMYRAEGKDWWVDEIEAGLGVPGPTVVSALKAHPELFEHTEVKQRRKYYGLTNDGRDHAIRLIGRNAAETVTQQGNPSNDDNL